MKLHKPTKKYEQEWKAGIDEFEAENRAGFWNMPTKPTDIEEYIQRTENQSKGLKLPDNWVPATTYWLIDKEAFIGHVNIRHKLNERLKMIGGNIGYAIRPKYRNQGYGKKLLELTLQKAKEIGLKKALLTCDDDNTASIKIIKKYGGVMASLKKQAINYRVIVKPDHRTGSGKRCYVAICPTLGVADDGDTVEEALANLQNTIIFHLESLKEEGKALAQF